MLTYPTFESLKTKSWGRIASPAWKDRLMAARGRELWVIPSHVTASKGRHSPFPIAEIVIGNEKLKCKVWAVKKGTLKGRPVQIAAYLPNTTKSY